MGSTHGVRIILPALGKIDAWLWNKLGRTRPGLQHQGACPAHDQKPNLFRSREVSPLAGHTK